MIILFVVFTAACILHRAIIIPLDLGLIILTTITAALSHRITALWCPTLTRATRTQSQTTVTDLVTTVSLVLFILFIVVIDTIILYVIFIVTIIVCVAIVNIGAIGLTLIVGAFYVRTTARWCPTLTRDIQTQSRRSVVTSVTTVSLVFFLSFFVDLREGEGVS